MTNSKLQISPKSKVAVLEALGLSPRDLLQQDEDGLPYLCQLARTGHLSRLPSDCLSPRVVLAHMGHDNNETANFLNFCAAEGHYKALPARYQSRSALLYQRRKNISKTPLDSAIARGKLSLFPLDNLKPKDFHPQRLRLICQRGEADCIEHLIDPKNVTIHILHCCFSRKYYPAGILKHMTAEEMLGDFAYSPLVAAACTGALEKVPTSLFIDHFQDAKKVLDAFRNELLASASPTIAASIDEFVRPAELWLLSLSHEVLTRAGAKQSLK